MAYQVGRSGNDLHTLLNTDSLGLEADGIAADSLDHLLSILQRRAGPGDGARIPERPAQRPRARARQSRPHAAVVDQRAGVQPHVPGRMEPLVARVTTRDDAPSCQFQFDLMERSGAGSPQRVLRLRRSERDRARLQRIAALPHAVPRSVQRQRDRELHVPGRHERGAVDRVRRHVGEHEHDEQLGRPHEPALVVQREQQAPREGDERCAARRLLARPVDQRVRHVHVQLAHRSRGESAGVVHAPTDADSGERRRMDRRVLARRFVSPQPRPANRVRRARRREPVRAGARVELRRPATSSSSQRPRPERRLREPARRLLVDVRHGAADRRVRGGGTSPARRGARRDRPLSEFVERVAAESGVRQLRATGRTAAGDVRRRRDAHS